MRHALRALSAPWFLVTVGVLTLLSVVVNSAVVLYAAYIFCLVALFLAVRPSLKIKNSAYFRLYFLKFFSFFAELIAWAICITALLIVWEFLLVPFGHVHSFMAKGPIVPFTIVNYIATAPASLAMFLLYLQALFGVSYYAAFFYLDKIGTVFMCFKKAYVLISYNVPAILMYSALMWFVNSMAHTVVCSSMVPIVSLIGSFCSLVYLAIFGIVNFLKYLFIFSLISNIYTKRVHDQYSLYQ